MSEEHPLKRIDYDGPLDAVFERAAEAYELGGVQGHQVIPIGYEDFNVCLQTASRDYLVKIFASARSPGEIGRYEKIMQAVIAEQVSVPPFHTFGSGLVYHDEPSGLAMVAMDFVAGETFYEKQRAPNDSELALVLEQAARINMVQHKPEFLFDSWAITNLTDSAYKSVEQYLTVAEREMVLKSIRAFNALDHAALPHCLVHGDIIKSNVLHCADGNMYILDFSVTNWYPRVQELAVIIGNLLNDTSRTESFGELLGKVTTAYISSGGSLTDAERAVLPDYARAAYVAEFISATREKFIAGNGSAENQYWLDLGRLGLTRSYQ